MKNFQDSKDSFNRKLSPIKTIGQLSASYIVAEILAEIRRDSKGEVELGPDSIIPLECINFNIPERAITLYNEACDIVNYKPIFMVMLKTSIEIMLSNEFDKDPSVTLGSKKETEHLFKISDTITENSNNTTYKDLAFINLFDHTLNVFEEAINYIKSNGSSVGLILPLIAALLHDFGKSTKLREKLKVSNGRGYKAHAEVSEIFVRDLFSEMVYNQIDKVPEETIVTIGKLCKNHHEGKKDSISGIELVKTADKKAREKEIIFIHKNRNNL